MDLPANGVAGEPWPAGPSVPSAGCDRLRSGERQRQPRRVVGGVGCTRCWAAVSPDAHHEMRAKRHPDPLARLVRYQLLRYVVNNRSSGLFRLRIVWAVASSCVTPILQTGLDWMRVQCLQKRGQIGEAIPTPRRIAVEHGQTNNPFRNPPAHSCRYIVWATADHSGKP